ncbi:MAG: NAD(P)-binding protein [Arcticibacter sp.]
MKIAVLGAGISGLSISRLLNDQHEVHVLEKKAHAGGIARTRTVDLVSYHLDVSWVSCGLRTGD